MIYFSCLQARRVFERAIFEPKLGAMLLSRVHLLLARRDNPHAIVISTPDQKQLGRYFEFGLYPLEVDAYKTAGGEIREDLTLFKPFDPRNVGRPSLYGALVGHDHGWGTHT